MASWLEELVTPEVLERFRGMVTRETPMPDALFDFEDVLEVIQLAETAIEQRSKTGREEGHAAAMRVASDPTKSFMEELPFTRMMLDMWRTDFVFPAIFRRSLLTTVCSHAEGVLRLWCTGLQQDGELRPLAAFAKKKTQRKSAIYLDYLLEVARLPIQDYRDWEEFRRLNAYWDVRNCIVHDAGVSERKLDLSLIVDFVSLDEEGLLMPRDRVVHVHPGACEDAAKAADAFFKRLGDRFLEVLAEQDPP